MGYGTIYLICLIWILAFIAWDQIEPPVVDTGISELHAKYDARAQIKNACMAFVERVD